MYAGRAHARGGPERLVYKVDRTGSCTRRRPEVLDQHGRRGKMVIHVTD
jgi:hypothetical protein